MDDTTRGVGGDDMSGRGDETTRNYAGEPARSTTRRPVSGRPLEGTRSAETSVTAGDTDTDMDPESERRAREIQGEIASTRAELSETIEAIQDRLRPSNLMSDAKEKVKSATTEKVKSMADTASGTAQEMMRETRERAQDFVEGAKQNPIPALMIGAGVAWLLMDRSRKGGNGRHRSYRGSRYSSPRYGYQGTDYYASSEYTEGTGSTDRTYGSYGNYGRGSSSGSNYGETGYAAGSYGESSSEGLSAKARDVAEQARRRARQTQNSLQRTLNENPLLVGAAAVLVGAAVGASLPETERENQWMGETRDNVVEKAQEAARDAAGAVREVAGETVGDAVGKVAKRAVSKDT
jgi:hypothetical protein